MLAFAMNAAEAVHNHFTVVSLSRLPAIRAAIAAETSPVVRDVVGVDNE